VETLYPFTHRSFEQGYGGTFSTFRFVARSNQASISGVSLSVIHSLGATAPDSTARFHSQAGKPGD
jgi:hypothetical protein